MFGLPTELITRGKLDAIKRLTRVDVSSVSPLSERMQSFLLKKG